MRIDHLILRNFRFFREQEFEFHPQFNLVIGDNGAGKTTVLDGVAVAAGSWFLGIRGYDSRSIETDEVRRVRQESGGVANFEGQYPVEVTAHGEVLGRAVEWTRTLDGPRGRTTRGKAAQVKALAEMAEKDVRSGEQITLPLISHYGAGRLWVSPKDMGGNSPSDLKTLQSRLDGYQFSLDPRINFADLFRWLKREKYVALQEGTERCQFTVVKAAILGCLDGGLSLDYDVREETLLITMRDRGVLPYRLLSAGQKAMVAMAADIGFKAALLNPQLEDRVLRDTPGVVIVDELDLHLHPRWQRQVVRDLQRTFPKIQFFASTHSPQVIGETHREQIIVLTSAGPERPSIGYGADANWLLDHVMGASARSEDAAASIKQTEDALDHGDLTSARNQLERLRELLGSEDGELARLQSSLDSWEALSREDD